jgi:signal recognition particle subunit SEC65
LEDKGAIGKVLLCISCGNKTFMGKVASYQDKEEEWDEDDYERFHVGTISKTWELYFCPVCHNVTLELIQWEDYHGCPEPRTYTIVYPAMMSKSQAVPMKIKRAFDAALKVRNIDGAICALSIRRTLEMMCKEKGETKGSLYQKLTNLALKGILPPILDKMASVLRTLGNNAAHAEDKDFPPKLVSSMIEFTEIILDYVYLLPKKLADIQSDIDKEKSNFATPIAETDASMSENIDVKDFFTI